MAMGSTPRHYLEKRRMDYAYRRLRMPDAQVKEVATTLGFVHLSHFSKWFKKHLGQSPRHFIRSLQSPSDSELIRRRPYQFCVTSIMTKILSVGVPSIVAVTVNMPSAGVPWLKFTVVPSEVAPSAWKPPVKSFDQR